MANEKHTPLHIRLLKANPEKAVSEFLFWFHSEEADSETGFTIPVDYPEYNADVDYAAMMIDLMQGVIPLHKAPSPRKLAAKMAATCQGGKARGGARIEVEIINAYLAMRKLAKTWGLPKGHAHYAARSALLYIALNVDDSINVIDDEAHVA